MKLVEGAVLEGNTTDSEIFISLKLLKDWGLVHSTFPQETVYNLINLRIRNILHFIHKTLRIKFMKKRVLMLI